MICGALQSSPPRSVHRVVMLIGILLALPLATIAAADAGEELRLVRSGFPHDSLFGLAFEGARGIAVGDHGVLLVTDDGGSSWVVDETVGVSAALLGVALIGERALVVGQEGLVLTRQGDGHWTRRESGTTERLLNVAMASDGLAVAVGGFGMLLRSRDHGQSWEWLQPNWEDYLADSGYEPHLFDVEILPDGRILLAGEFGLVLLSRDRGETWEQVNSSDESLFGMAVLPDGSGVAVGQNGYVIRTEDGGERWTKISVPSEANLLDAWLSGNGTMVVTGIRAMLTSTNGGHSWTVSSSTEVVRNWYSALASSDGLASAEGALEGKRLYMAGMLGMIQEINLTKAGDSGDPNP